MIKNVHVKGILRIKQVTLKLTKKMGDESETKIKSNVSDFVCFRRTDSRIVKFGL